MRRSRSASVELIFTGGRDRELELTLSRVPLAGEVNEDARHNVEAGGIAEGRREESIRAGGLPPRLEYPLENRASSCGLMRLAAASRRAASAS